nr:hypothetical protein [Bradyrhizobium sp. 41S5]
MMVSKFDAKMTSKAPMIASTFAVTSGTTRPQRSAIQPPIGLNAMATQDAKDVSNATCAAVSWRLRVIGPRPALNAELAKASRKRPPRASHQMTPARPLIPVRESTNDRMSSTPRSFIVVDFTLLSSPENRSVRRPKQSIDVQDDHLTDSLKSCFCADNVERASDAVNASMRIWVNV